MNTLLCGCLGAGLLVVASSAVGAGSVVVVDAPSNLGLRPPSPGVEPGARKLAQTLRRTGLLERLQATDGGRVDAPPYSPHGDATGFRNGAALARYSAALADRLAASIGAGDFTLVLGGDCSVLLGSGVALKRRGRYGLAFVDAHDDYTFPRNPATYRGHYAAAGLDLGLATGHGTPALSNIDGLGPYFRESDVVHIGLSREEGDAEYGDLSKFEQSGIHILDVGVVKKRGADAVAREARERLEAAELDGYWIHVDADVLDASIMPAVDSPNANGLTFAQLSRILATLIASPKAVGLELTIYDPDLDPKGDYARGLADAIVRAFDDSGRFKR